MCERGGVLLRRLRVARMPGRDCLVVIQDGDTNARIVARKYKAQRREIFVIRGRSPALLPKGARIGNRNTSSNPIEETKSSAHK